MSEVEAIRAALTELGRHVSADEVRKWCSRRGVMPSASFDKLVEEEKARIRAALLEESRQKMVEELQKVNALLEERVRLRGDQLSEADGEE